MKGNWIFRKRWFRILLVFLVLTVAILWIAGKYLSANYESIFRERLSRNLPEAVHIDFGSLQINLLGRTVEVEDLKIVYHPDSIEGCHPSALTIARARFQGIHVTQLFFFESLEINSVVLADMKATAYSTCFRDTLQKNVAKNSKPPIKKIKISNLDLDKCVVNYYSDSSKALEAVAGITVEALSIPSLTNIRLRDISFENLSAAVSDIKIIPGEAAYFTYVKNVNLSGNNRVTVDSLQVIPRYKKYEFAKHIGKEIDRFEVLIPKIEVYNFDVKQVMDSTLRASGVHIYNANFSSFRDKRLPFVRHRNRQLPAALLKELPYTLALDTIRIYNAFISYEEFPEDGTEAGIIEFHELDATAFNISNRQREGKPQHIDLDVRTRFMNAAVLNASFDIPVDPELKPYTVTGNLTNMELTTLNDPLTHLAMMRIQSGMLNELAFDFSFNDNESHGNVVLNYQNLKIVTLEEKEAKTQIDKFKTFLLNTFIIRKNKDENLAEDKRSGTIHFERDKKRSVFNFLWKSILSGIKASYNLENLLTGNRNDKKNRKKKGDRG